MIGRLEEPSGDLPSDWLSFNPVDLASTRQDWEEEKEGKKKDEKQEEKGEEKEEDKKEEEEEDPSLAASRMTHTGVPAREGRWDCQRFPPSIFNLNLSCRSRRQ